MLRGGRQEDFPHLAGTVLKNLVGAFAAVRFLYKEDAVFGILAQFDNQVGVAGGLR